MRSHVNSLKYDFKDASIKRMILKLPIPGFGAALAEESSFFTMGQMSKKLYQFSLPEEPPKKVCFSLVQLYTKVSIFYFIFGGGGGDERFPMICGGLL